LAWINLSTTTQKIPLRSWFKTPKFLQDVASLAHAGAVWIGEKFDQTAIPINLQSVGWGQYRDTDSKQTGLYGTVAGAFVLSNQNNYHSNRQKAIEYLLQRFERRDIEQKDNYQFQLMPKIASFLTAFNATDLIQYPRALSACHTLVGELASAQLVGSGWGYYYSSNAVKDIKPSIASTSLILLAVNSLNMAQLLPNWDHAITWLAHELSIRYKLIFPGELALGLLALRLGHLGQSNHSLPRIAKDAHNWLITQARVNPASWQEYFVSYATVTEVASTQESNDEYFVIQSPFVILKYLLLHEPLIAVSPGIFEHLLSCLRNIESNKCYVSDLNGRVSTRANQSAYELCKLFEVEINRSFNTFVIYRYVAGLRMIITNRLILFTLVTLLIAWALEASPFTPNGWFSLIIVSIITNILANIIYERI